MKAQEFEAIKANVNEYVGKLVKFEHYIPSADRMTTSTGYIVGVGEEVFKEYIIIAFAGRKAIHYKDVEILPDKPTIKDVEEQVSVLTDDEQQLLKDAINEGCWGDADCDFLKAPNTTETETVRMMGYCTNDAHKAGHFEGRKISSMFRSIYRKMCQFESKVGYVLSHCNDWWGDGSGDMLFIREGWDEAFELWARRGNQ